MPSVLTKACQVQCTTAPLPPPPPPPAPPPPPLPPTVHGGLVTTGPGSSALCVNNSPVLTMVDIASMPIPDCKTPKPPAATAPCTAVGPSITGQSQRLKVGGQPVMLSTLAGATMGGNPPGVLVANSVQAILTSD